MSSEKPSTKTRVRGVFSGLFQYETARTLRINSQFVGIVFHLVQAVIISYIILWAIWYKKGYQEVDQAHSSVTTKLSGVTYTSHTDEELKNVPREWRHLYKRVWDVSDYVVPHSEEGALFMTTNVIITPDQTQGICSESPKVRGAVCNPRRNSCLAGNTLSHGGHGVMTGRCIKTASHFHELSPTGHTCEIHAWCPIEKNVKPLGPHGVLLSVAENFTLLIKNQIVFPKFGVSRTNILSSFNKTYLSSCRYDPVRDPYCPIFKIGTIAKLTGQNFTWLAVNGSVVSLGIKWDCDLDYDIHKCRPKYSFRRIDSGSSLAPGWNFRHSRFFSNGKRTLYKAYGILFVVDVQGTGRQFSPIPLLLKLGSGLGLLGVASVLCDFLVFHCLKDKKIFKEKKYLEVSRKDAFVVYKRKKGTEDIEEDEQEAQQLNETNGQ